ncbi:MAG TPA: SAM-dependent methyltransferase [Polyangiaceae bacterium]|nr:SAM-dependent methyltransferase [Polyangiaceae bacterium]
MRKGWASQTAMWVAALRGLAELDDPRIVSDPLAVKLLPRGYRDLLTLASRSPRVSRALLVGAARASKNLSRHLAMRTRAIDDVVVSEALNGTEQLVLLGAGFDARAWRLDQLTKTTVFEIDFPSTQRGKREGIGDREPLAKSVKWAPIDFAKGDDVADVLARAGHDRAKRTTFVWEGVTMYLESDAIDATLASVARVSAPGSVIAFTYHAADPKKRWEPWESVPLTVLVRVAGEPFKTRMTKAGARARLEAHGFRVESDEGSDDWSARYLRQPGYRDGERLVVARLL